MFPHYSLVVSQSYDIYVEMEHVIFGNDAILKCKVPSHLIDFVSVSGWVDNKGNEVLPSASSMNNGILIMGRTDIRVLWLRTYLGHKNKDTNLSESLCLNGLLLLLSVFNITNWIILSMWYDKLFNDRS